MNHPRAFLLQVPRNLAVEHFGSDHYRSSSKMIYIYMTTTTTIAVTLK